MTVASGPGSANCLAAGRRDLISPDDPRLYSFRAVTGVPDNGPPPYFQHRGRRGNREVLPPLPTYEDATKLPPLRHNMTNDESEEVVEETTELSNRSTNQSTGHTTNDQTSSTTLSPNSETRIVATVRGNEMIRPSNTTRHPDTTNSGTPVDENPETSSISSASSATSDASSKPEHR